MEHLTNLALEQQKHSKLKEQMELVTEGNGGDFENLIDLGKIAEKAKEEKIRREERMRNGDSQCGQSKQVPFRILGLVKEDLNIVMQRESNGSIDVSTEDIVRT